MGWTFDQIAGDWIINGQLAASPDEICAAFDLVEQTLGRDWIEWSRSRSGSVQRGLHPTLDVVMVGQLLPSILHLQENAKLIAGLKELEPSAIAEIISIHLVGGSGPTDIELEPYVAVGDRIRRPDFRCRVPGDEWTYVEVCRPDIAEARENADAILSRLVAPVHELKRSFSLEIFLRKEPSEQEIEELCNKIRGLSIAEGRQVIDLGLAKLTLNRDEPGSIVMGLDDGEERVPRLMRSTFVGMGEEPPRHVCVRMPYADERAALFLQREAKQLPPQYPGLLMVDVLNAAGGFKS